MKSKIDYEYYVPDILNWQINILKARLKFYLRGDDWLKSSVESIQQDLKGYLMCLRDMHVIEETTYNALNRFYCLSSLEELAQELFGLKA